MTGLPGRNSKREAVRDLVGRTPETNWPPARPLLTRDDAYDYLNKFVVAEVTTKIRGIPVEVPLGRRECMRKPCVANCDNLRTVPRQALTERIAILSQRRIPEVKRAIGYAFGWAELIDAELTGLPPTR